MHGYVRTSLEIALGRWLFGGYFTSPPRAMRSTWACPFAAGAGAGAARSIASAPLRATSVALKAAGIDFVASRAGVGEAASITLPAASAALSAVRNFIFPTPPTTIKWWIENALSKVPLRYFTGYNFSKHVKSGNQGSGGRVSGVPCPYVPMGAWASPWVSPCW